jgi:hypothetical protein
MGICPGFSSRCMILSCHDSVSVPREAAQEPKSLRPGTFAPLRRRNGLSQVERSHEPKRGFFPGAGGVRVGLPVPRTLLDESFRHIGQY